MNVEQKVRNMTILIASYRFVSISLFVVPIESCHFAGQELSNGVLAAVEVGEIPGGRKMATKRAPGGMMKEVAGLKGDDISRIKGVAHYLGNCKHVGGRKGTLKANCRPRKLGHAPPVDAGMAGFAVFSSDYHLSRPHPPKNN